MAKVKFTKLLDRTKDERIESEQELPPGMTEEDFFKANPTYEPVGGGDEAPSGEEE